MKMLCSVQLSQHRYKTPEGYLVCKDCIIARTGKQTYLKAEIGRDDGSDEEYIDIDRKPEQVFDEKTMASFEGKPLTIEHPEESVSPQNYKTLSVGNVHNVRKGKFEGQDVMYADINVYDAEAINLIESGDMEELSCGYDCDITEGPNPEQINIRGNHVALCEQGRAGIARIQDSKTKKKEWGVKPIKDAASRGTLIQEFGKQGKQYKITKINGNVIYAEELTTGKIVLFKKDEENVEWAVITKSEVRDSYKITIYDIILETNKCWEFTLNQVEKRIREKYGYTVHEAEERVKNHQMMLVPIVLSYGNVGETQIEKLSIGPFDSEDEAKEFYKTDLEAFINSIKADNEAVTVLYQDKSKYIADKKSDSESRIKSIMESKAQLDYNNDDLPGSAEKWATQLITKDLVNELSRQLTADEKELVREYAKYIYDEYIPNYEKALEEEGYTRPNDYSDSFTTEELDEYIRGLYGDRNTGKRKSKIFVDKAKRDEFVKSLPKEAEAMMDEFDHVFDDGRYLVYWEVYYWDDRFKDSFAPLYIIQLEDNSYLDDNDRPTEDINKAKRFTTEDEANNYRKIYCSGTVKAINDSVKDEDPEEKRFDAKKEVEVIKRFLDEKKIGYSSIGHSYNSPTIDFENVKEMKKAAKLLNSYYEIELFEGDPKEGEMYIAVYEKRKDPFETTNDSVNWRGYNIIKGKPAEDFKQYLRDRGLYFEPSENGRFVHFEVKNADEDVEKEIRAINKHYSETSIDDSYSKRFYISAIKSMKDKLEKLKRNELIDSNQKDYEEQKASMTKELERQIAEYEKKLNELDRN